MQHLPECQLILNKLKNELPINLYYHSIDHTLDVYHCAESIGKQEGISDADMKLLLVAAIYHDVGYLIEKQKHEEHSCDMARMYLPNYNYSTEEVNTICTLIMATKMPQKPKSHLEEIICDADLDYLGRSDYFNISKRLYKEMMAFGTITNWEEWIQIQKIFLQNHHYFTKTAIDLRKAEKEKNLKIIQSKNN
jgi:uncharacterized protein